MFYDLMILALVLLSGILGWLLYKADKELDFLNTSVEDLTKQKGHLEDDLKGETQISAGLREKLSAATAKLAQLESPKKRVSPRQVGWTAGRQMAEMQSEMENS